MNIKNLLSEYDSLFGRYPLEYIYDWLQEKIEEASDYPAIQISLLNELMGLSRDGGRKELCLDCIAKLEKLLDASMPQDTDSYASALENIANACRVLGDFEKSERLFNQAEGICLAKENRNLTLLSAIYNNKSLLFMAKQQAEAAYEIQKKAIALIDSDPASTIEQAIARLNFVNLLLSAKENPDALTEADHYLKEALEVFEPDHTEDYHYSAALNTNGFLKFKLGNYKESAESFKKSAEEMKKHSGICPDYEKAMNNYRFIVEKYGPWE